MHDERPLTEIARRITELKLAGKPVPQALINSITGYFQKHKSDNLCVRVLEELKPLLTELDWLNWSHYRYRTKKIAEGIREEDFDEWNRQEAPKRLASLEACERELDASIAELLRTAEARREGTKSLREFLLGERDVGDDIYEAIGTLDANKTDPPDLPDRLETEFFSGGKTDGPPMAYDHALNKMIDTLVFSLPPERLCSSEMMLSIGPTILALSDDENDKADSDERHSSKYRVALTRALLNEYLREASGDPEALFWAALLDYTADRGHIPFDQLKRMYNAADAAEDEALITIVRVFQQITRGFMVCSDAYVYWGGEDDDDLSDLANAESMWSFRDEPLQVALVRLGFDRLHLNPALIDAALNPEDMYNVHGSWGAVPSSAYIWAVKHRERTACDASFGWSCDLLESACVQAREEGNRVNECWAARYGIFLSFLGDLEFYIKQGKAIPLPITDISSLGARPDDDSLLKSQNLGFLERLTNFTQKQFELEAATKAALQHAIKSCSFTTTAGVRADAEQELIRRLGVCVWRDLPDETKGALITGLSLYLEGEEADCDPTRLSGGLFLIFAAVEGAFCILVSQKATRRLGSDSRAELKNAALGAIIKSIIPKLEGTDPSSNDLRKELLRIKIIVPDLIKLRDPLEQARVIRNKLGHGKSLPREQTAKAYHLLFEGGLLRNYFSALLGFRDGDGEGGTH